MAKRFFIGGTDTEVGKTTITVGLLKALSHKSYQTLAFKPIASGCHRHQGQLYNDDALQLAEAATIKLPYGDINPFAYEPAIAPHIAAEKVNSQLVAAEVTAKLLSGFSQPADYYLVEGVGGWHVPLNAHETVADIVRALQLPVILVVGIKLGCLNHSLLTVEAIERAGLTLCGWVANCLHPDSAEIAANIMTLKQWIKAPCMGIVPFQAVVEEHLSLEPLTK
ncbi:MAG: dethiobiotin synthase [Gammaproteobacteria bacterium]|nr:dethiobiotin synthase [Gammaproteobacteria bacterium]MCP4474707.1 dethiobiotin synthase [Gammaproteobacteria bacterium]